jgi:hypothetical protein
MMRFSIFHAIAAQRGDGLKPELIRVLDQARLSAVPVTMTEASHSAERDASCLPADRPTSLPS